MRRRLCAVGVLLWLVSLVVALAIGLRTPWLADALLWRLDRWSGAPTVSQRIFEKQLTRLHLVKDRLVPAGSALVFGDSHLQVLPFGGANIYNFAIGGQTAARVLSQMAQFRSQANARAVVLGGGHE